MESPVTPVTLSWEAQIDERVNLAKFSLQTDSFIAFHAIMASDVLAEIDHEKTFQLAIGATGQKSVSDILKQINVRTVANGQSNYDEFSKKVESLKNRKPDKDDWEKTIDSAAEDAKRKSNKTIDDAANAAKAEIRKLPEHARQPAANVFKKGLSTVVGFFQEVWASIGKVIKAIADFIRGIWDKLKAAWEAVKNAAKSAIKWISGLFGFAAAEATWPSEFSATKVNGELSLLLEDLSQQGLEVDDLSMHKSTNGWVVKTALNCSNGQNLAGGLDTFWKRSVSTKTSAVASVMA